MKFINTKSWLMNKTGALAVRDIEDQFVPLLKNCSNFTELNKIHAHIVKFSLSQSNFLVTKMIDICNGCGGHLQYAHQLFDQITQPNIFLYNAHLRILSHNQFYADAIAVYKRILGYPERVIPVFPDKFTFPIVLKVCGGCLWLDLGREIHGHVWRFGAVSNSVVGNSLIDMYLKCGSLSDAEKVFDEMSERDVVSWNSVVSGYARAGQMKRARAMFDYMPEKTVVSWTTLISGYVRIGCYAEALDVFRKMQLVGMRPDEISIVAVLPACAQLGALEVGKWIHIYSDKNGLMKNICICNALIEMYAKCGGIYEACKLFEWMADRDVISWSTMIMGLANHGRAEEAIRMFVEMGRAKVEPNGVTFLGLLSACAHAGFVTKGLRYFDSMKSEYFIDPGVEHYGCVIDLLGRSGHLDQAVEFIKKLPFKPDSSIWGSVLSACRTHNNLELAVTATEQLLELEPDDTGNYVLLSNVYAAMEKWDGVSRMRKLMRNMRVKKTPGCSLIEVDNIVQEFVVGDETKPFSHEIYCMLDLLDLDNSTGTSNETTIGDIMCPEFGN
ncbi:hypothetical protein Sjap_018516 [Stephania japonica]|uniref:Chlororespiratory reduction 2 n=1 Tax=Stephania japonica TaxID=461633 RepID=A0AAP0NNA1_9MAGN